MKYNIYHNININAPSDKVFTAISSPQKLIHWWPKICTCKEELGGIYRLFFTEEYDWMAKVEVYDPNYRFVLSMIKSDEDWAETYFGFDLEADKSKTLVRFSHMDWPRLNDHYKTASYCWAILLNGLKDYVENGIIVPFENRS